MGVKSAGVGKNPHSRSPYSLGLKAKDRLRSRKGHAKRCDTKDRHEPRLVLEQFATKRSGSSDELLRAQLVG